MKNNDKIRNPLRVLDDSSDDSIVAALDVLVENLASCEAGKVTMSSIRWDRPHQFDVTITFGGVEYDVRYNVHGRHDGECGLVSGWPEIGITAVRREDGLVLTDRQVSELDADDRLTLAVAELDFDEYLNTY